MSIGRVANYALMRYFFSHVHRSKANSDKYAVQSMTEEQGQLLKDLGLSSSRFLRMGRDFELSQAYQAGNTDLKIRYSLFSNTYAAVSKLMENFKLHLSDMQGHRETASVQEIQHFQQQTFSFYKQLASLLNLKHDGNYVFGGQVANHPPVNNPYQSLEDFQRIFNGEQVNFPQTVQAHHSKFVEDGEGLSWLRFIQDDGTGYSVMEDSNHLGRFGKVEVGSVLHVEGTDGNDGYYTVVEATPNRVSIRPMVLQKEGPLKTGVSFELQDKDGSKMHLDPQDVVFDPETGKISISNPQILKNVKPGDMLHVHGTLLNDRTFTVKGLSPDGKGLLIDQHFFRSLGGASRELLFSKELGRFKLNVTNTLGYDKTTKAGTDSFISDPYATPPTPLVDGTAYGVISAPAGSFRDPFGNLLPVGTVIRLTDTPGGDNNGLYKIMGIKQDGSGIALLPYSETSGTTSALPSTWKVQAKSSGFITPTDDLSNMTVAAEDDHITLPKGALRHKDGFPLKKGDEIYLTGSQNGNNGRFRIDRVVKNSDGTETFFFEGDVGLRKEKSQSFSIFLRTSEPTFEFSQNRGFTVFKEDGKATTLQSPSSNQLTLGGTAGNTFTDQNGNDLVLGSEITILQANGQEVKAHVRDIVGGKTVTLDKTLSSVDLKGATVRFSSSPPPIHLAGQPLTFHHPVDGSNDQVKIDLVGFMRFSNLSPLPQGGYEFMLRDTVTGEQKSIRIKSYEEVGGQTILTLDDDQSISGLTNGLFDLNMFSEFQMVTMHDGQSYVTAPPGTFMKHGSSTESLEPGTVISYGDYRHAENLADLAADQDVDYNGRDTHSEGTFAIAHVNADGSQVLVRSSGQPIPYKPMPDRSLTLINQGVVGKVTAVGNYYQGDTQPHRYVMDEQNVIDVKDNAGEPLFEKMFRAMGLLMQGNLGEHRERFDQALWLLKSALNNKQPREKEPFGRESAENLERKVEDLNFDQRRLELINKYMGERERFLETSMSDLLSVDKREAMAKFGKEQSTITTSYKVLTRFSKVSLLDYL